MRRSFAFLMLFLCLVAVGPASSEPVPASTGTGVIRVLLTNLQLTDRLDIALDGSYTITGGAAFQRGSKVTASTASGSVMLHYEGMALNAGKSLVFSRHAVAEGLENGLRFNEGYPLFPGDLHLSERSGMLEAILHIPVEEYLPGVLPYEMSDTFPLEALKAQAVAARTYALRKAGSGASYDIVDNANDQVYRGTVPEHLNSARAVLETEGTCGTYRGRLAETFYCASNGGQTELPEHVWGKGDHGYLSVADDPYDVENPQSEVRTFHLYRKAQDNDPDSVLWQALGEKAAQLMEDRGYEPESNRFNIIAVESLVAHSPRGAEPSRLMTRMRFDLHLSRQHLSIPDREEEEVFLFQQSPEKPEPVASESPLEPVWSDWLPVAGVVSVDLPIFPFLEQVMELSINRDDNELVTVREEDNRFVVEARRYGHGVGMSQRGAQQMAGVHGWTFQQILSFYYPGMTLEKRTYESPILPALPYTYLATPGPAATPTPRPTLMPATLQLQEGWYRVRVTLIDRDSSLNLRDMPGTAGSVVLRLLYGQELVVTGKTEDGWLQVRTDAAEGYVMEKFVERVDAPNTPTP